MESHDESTETSQQVFTLGQLNQITSFEQLYFNKEPAKVDSLENYEGLPKLNNNHFFSSQAQLQLSK